MSKILPDDSPRTFGNVLQPGTKEPSSEEEKLDQLEDDYGRSELAKAFDVEEAEFITPELITYLVKIYLGHWTYAAGPTSP